MTLNLRLKPLRKVLKLEYGKPLPREDRHDAGTYAAYGANGIKCRTNRCLVDTPSIVVGRKGSAGEVTLTDGPFWPLDVTYYVAFDHGEYDLMYLFHCLKFLDLPRLATGVKPGINRNAVYDIESWFPSLPEQRRIVAILDAAFEGIDTAIANAERSLSNCDQLQATILDTAAEGRLPTRPSDPKSVGNFLEEIQQLRSKSAGKKRLKDFDFLDGGPPSIRLPLGWRWIPLGNLTSKISDGVHKKPSYVSSGIPFVTVRNLTAGPGISFTDLKYITEEDHREFIRRTHPEKGDILIAKDGTIGIVRAVTTDVEFSIFVSVALIKPASPALTDYLKFMLQALIVQSQIVPKGTALKHLYLADLRRLAVPFPSREVQNEVVGRLQVFTQHVDSLRSCYAEKLLKLRLLKESLLRKAFTGEMNTVTDPLFNAAGAAVAAE